MDVKWNIIVFKFYHWIKSTNEKSRNILIIWGKRRKPQQSTMKICLEQHIQNEKRLITVNKTHGRIYETSTEKNILSWNEKKQKQ